MKGFGTKGVCLVHFLTIGTVAQNLNPSKLATVPTPIINALIVSYLLFSQNFSTSIVIYLFDLLTVHFVY